MNENDITIVVGIDRKHLEELRWTWPTWMRFKPELRKMPLVVFYDPAQVDVADTSFLHEHKNLRLVPWEWRFSCNQRERMITGLVHIPATEVETPWYLKIDTDTIATGHGKWLDKNWFQPGPGGEPPVFISSPWGYSKPSNVMDLYDNWGDNVPELARFPRLNLPYSPTSARLFHSRIISWLFFGRTDWTRQIASWLGPDGRLPHGSQDSFLFYCAKRTGKWFLRDRMKKYHWSHKSLKSIRKMAITLEIFPEHFDAAEKQAALNVNQ